MHPFQVLLALFAVLCLAALVLLLRWERSYFLQRRKSSGWLRVRLATIPIALATAAIIIVPARATSGMEGLAVFYILLLTIAPVFWFSAHWMVGKLALPPLSFSESSLIAGSPLVLGFMLTIVAHSLQSIAWSMLRSLGLA